MESSCSKHTGSKPSSLQDFMQVRPLAPAPMIATFIFPGRQSPLSYVWVRKTFWDVCSVIDQSVLQNLFVTQTIALHNMADEGNEMSASCSNTFILGIDIGTTSIKASLLSHNIREVIESVRRETNANISDKNTSFVEQDVRKILSVLQDALGQLSPQLLARVNRIGICGQMHGCVLWKRGYCMAKSWDTSKNNVSNLITWEDRRCTNEFLATLPLTQTDVAISTGFGCASLFWLQRNYPSLLERYDCAGTIMDFIVCLLCQLEEPCMSSQNAVSWGYFDVENMKWELDL